MEEAIQRIKASDNIRQEIAEIQEDMVAEEKIRIMTSSQKVKPNDASNYRLICKCGKFEIDCSVLRCIDKNNYAALDITLWNKIEEEPLTKKPFNKGEAVMQSKWHHTGCSKELGTVYLYKKFRVLYLSQAAFNYYRMSQENGHRPESVGKWKNLPFHVPDLRPAEYLTYCESMVAQGASNDPTQ
jgi:hypothetical protein